MNGGTCRSTSLTTGTYTCTCTAGFSGATCTSLSSPAVQSEVVANPCLTSPCKNGGKCSQTSASYKCSCPVGVSGNNCEISNSNPCSFNPCQNGGTCIRNGTQYTCSCAQKFVGTNCENVDGCCGNPCLNGGVCTNANNGVAICHCVDGYTGPYCQRYKYYGILAPINGCAKVSCGVNGECVTLDLSGGFICVCSNGYYGTYCDKQYSYPTANSPYVGKAVSLDFVNSHHALCSKSSGSTTTYHGHFCDNSGQVQWNRLETVDVHTGAILPCSWSRSNFVSNALWLSQWLGQKCGDFPAAIPEVKQHVKSSLKQYTITLEVDSASVKLEKSKNQENPQVAFESNDLRQQLINVNGISLKKKKKKVCFFFVKNFIF